MNTTTHLLASTFLALGMTSLALTACDDPSKGKARATTGEAIASATTQSATTPPLAGAVHLRFDQGRSKVSWVGSKVTGKHEGGFATFEGSIDVVEGAPDRSRVVVEIEADSITSDTAKLTGHLKSPDFFDTKSHPKASFVSTAVHKGGENGATHTITGNLTIKGITKSVSFPATVSLGAGTASVDAEFAINRRDFSLNYAGMPNDLIRDDVLIKLAIRASKG